MSGSNPGYVVYTIYIVANGGKGGLNFPLVSSFLREAELKNDTTSVRVIECVSEKLDHCVRNITKIDSDSV